MVGTSSNITIFDRTLLRRNRQRARENISTYGFLFELAAERLADRLGDIRHDFPRALDIGARHITPLDSPQAAARNVQKVIHLDTGAYADAQDNILRVSADEEFLPFADASFDMVTSTLSLHATNDLPGTLLQIRRILKPDGLFLAALLGGETLYELRHSLMAAEIEMKGGASPRVFPFADKQQMGALMQRAGFALPVVDSEIITVTYDNMFDLVRDLRGMGEGNIIHDRSKTYPGRDFFHRAAAHYQEMFAESGGRVKTSFEIIFLIGWAPHESQQKPLKPGSAENRLADALQTSEIPAGEKASS